ncbi:MAG: hypothetical protein WD070_10675 [Pirellulaceae bacterium]
MARLEQDREDLIREATALVRRVELQCAGQAEPWVVGFRRGGEASIFAGAQLVFQFNAAGELRRGFWNSRLVKAEAGRLIQLQRRRTEDEVQLVRHELAGEQTAEFLRLAAETLNQLRRVLDTGELVILKRVPDDLNVIQALKSWLESLPEPIAIASAPNVTS